MHLAAVTLVGPLASKFQVFPGGERRHAGQVETGAERSLFDAKAQTHDSMVTQRRRAGVGCQNWDSPSTCRMRGGEAYQKSIDSPRERVAQCFRTVIDYRFEAMLTPVGRTSLRTHLTSQLFDAILRGELRPGERIVEGKLARELGVAQSTLREALQQLEHQGLLTKSDRRGTFVTKLTVRDVEALYAVRLELEPLAGALACERMKPEHFRQLEHTLQEMREAARERAFVELLKSDLGFHQSIWRFSGNSYLEKALNVVCPPLFASYMMRVVSGDLYDFAKDDEEHAALLAALRKGGPQTVRKAFRAMTEVFRLQDVENLRSVEARQPVEAPKKQAGVPTKLSEANETVHK